MKNFEKRRTTVIICSLLILAIVAACGMLANTYAKYTSTINRTATNYTVAKWSFDTDNSATTFDIELDRTDIDQSTLKQNKIAPGTSGKFDILLNNANTDTGVKYTITLDQIEGMPENLKFYKDPVHRNELFPNNSESKITGTLQAQSSQRPETITIYWNWEYETKDGRDVVGDVDDTTAGKNAADSFSVGVTIKGEQVMPSSTGIMDEIQR